jgi:exonuclease III
MASASGVVDETPPGQQLLHRRLETRICTMNVRSGNDANIIDLANHLASRNIPICAVQEVRRAGCGSIDFGEYALIYSGVTAGRHGVGFLVRNGLKFKLRLCTDAPDRICRLDVDGFSVVCVYAPTEANSTNDEKDDFYAKLQAFTRKCARRKPMLMCGDFNARVGLDYRQHPAVGSELSGVSRTNQNGIRLLNMMMEEDMILCNTTFRKSRRKKETWQHAKGKRATLDYVAVCKRWRNTVTDVEAHLPKPALNSDHNMLVIKTRLRFPACNVERPARGTKTETFDVDTFKQLPSKPQRRTDTDIDEKWQHLCARIKLSTQSNEERFKFASHRAKRENVDGRTAIERMWQERAERMNELASEGKHHAVYGELKKALGWVKKHNTVDPRLIKEQIIDVSGVVNGVSELSGTINELRSSVVCTAVPTLDETRAAVLSLKANKAAGPDRIPTRFWRNETLLKELHAVVCAAWIEGIPTAWRVSKVAGIKKKAGGFRTIALTNSAHKAYMAILKRRLEDRIRDFVGPTQFGFQRGRSTLDAVSSIERRRERLSRSRMTERLVLLDFSKAFDRVKPSAINRALVEAGVDDETRMHVLDAIDGSMLLVGNEIVCPRDGTKQGCVLSPALFTMVLALVTRALPCRHLEYADDLAIIVENDDAAEEVIELIAAVGAPLGLTLNIAKTEKRTLGRQCDATNYLGVTLADRHNHLATRCRKADAAYACLYRKLFKRSVAVSVGTKLQIFRTMVESVLCYGVHAVAHSRERLRKTLDWFMLRKTKAIMGYDATAHISYGDMERELQQYFPMFEWPSTTVARGQARLLGHELRADPDLAKLLPLARPGRGRPPNDMASVVLQNLKDAGLVEATRADLAELAEDRDSWRLLVGGI